MIVNNSADAKLWLKMPKIIIHNPPYIAKVFHKITENFSQILFTSDSEMHDLLVPLIKMGSYQSEKLHRYDFL